MNRENRTRRDSQSVLGEAGKACPKEANDRGTSLGNTWLFTISEKRKQRILIVIREVVSHAVRL